MADCPVCGRSGLAAILRTCPQCNANLECFQWLDALHEREPDRTDLVPVQRGISQQAFHWLWPLFIILLVGTVLVGLFLLDQQRVAHHKDRQIFEEERTHWQARVIGLERQLSSLAQFETTRLQRHKEMNGTMLQVEKQLSSLLVQQGLSPPAKHSAEDAEGTLEERLLALQTQLAHFLTQQTPPILPIVWSTDEKKPILHLTPRMTDRLSSYRQWEY